MTELWNLPVRAVIAGKTYELHGDFRDILEIFSYLDDPDLPDYLKWRIALALFFEGEIPEKDRGEAMDYFMSFVRCGQRGAETPGPKLLDWDRDAPVIIADVNKVAGQEIRALPFVHWWTFMAWFHAIGEGQLAALVSIRDKLRRGKKLEGWEQDFYRENRERVELPKRYSREELLQQERLNAMLNGRERNTEGR